MQIYLSNIIPQILSLANIIYKKSVSPNNDKNIISSLLIKNKNAIDFFEKTNYNSARESVINT